MLLLLKRSRISASVWWRVPLENLFLRFEGRSRVCVCVCVWTRSMFVELYLLMTMLDFFFNYYFSFKSVLQLLHLDI